MYINFRTIAISLVLIFSSALCAQSVPIWQIEHSDGPGTSYNMVQIETVNDDAFVLAEFMDTSCAYRNYTLFHFSSSGNYVGQVDYLDSGCTVVILRHLLEFDDKLYVAADDSVQFLVTTGMVQTYDQNLNLLHTSRTPETSQDLAIRGSNPLSYVFSADGGVSLNCFDTAGALRWSFQEPLLFGLATGFHKIDSRNDTIFAMSSGYTSVSETNTSIIVTTLDTNGNYIDTIQVAPFGVSNHHVVADVRLTSFGFVYSAHAGFTTGPSKTGLMDFFGNIVWENNVPDIVRFQAVDSTSNQVFVFTSGSVSSAAYQCFRIDLVSGNILDTILIDSAYSGSDWICFLHEEGVGVYMAYRNQQSIGSYVIERYNIYGLVDWYGTFSTNGPQLHRLKEMEISDVGSLYIVGWAIGDSSIICKFSPPPLGSHETDRLNTFRVYPNPASSIAIIHSNGDNNLNTVHLFNSSGELVFNSLFIGSYYELATTSYPSGIYLIEVVSESGERHTQKLIIQHQ